MPDPCRSRSAAQQRGVGPEATWTHSPADRDGASEGEAVSVSPHEVISAPAAGGRTGSSEPPGTRAHSDPILILSDEAMFACTLRITLRQYGLDARQGPAGGIADIVAHSRRLRPTLAILDLRRRHLHDGQGADGATLIRSLIRLGCGVLVISGDGDRPGQAAAVAAGALGLVPKTASLPTLLDSVRAAVAGQAVMPDDVRQAWLRFHDRRRAQQRERSRRLDRLSTRESEVLRLLAQGMRAADIAGHFVVSITTVRTQVRSILTKLEVGSQLEAVALFCDLRPPR